MNRKEREVKVIVGIAFAAIMIASIFAIVAPITMAGTNGGFLLMKNPRLRLGYTVTCNHMGMRQSNISLIKTHLTRQ